MTKKSGGVQNKPISKYQWLNSHELFKVYHAEGERNDGVVVFRNRQVADKGVKRGQEYDKVTIVPFFETPDGNIHWRSQKRKLKKQNDKGNWINTWRKEYPLVSINVEAARDLAKTILQVAEEKELTEGEILETKQDDELKEKWKKMESVGI